MAAFLLFLCVLVVFLSLLLGIVYVAYTVREHMSKSPDAAKAIYEHVFLPVMVGTSKPAKTEEEDEAPTIDPSEFKL